MAEKAEDKIYDYILKGLEEGHHPDDLKAALINAGWPEKDVNKLAKSAINNFTLHGGKIEHREPGITEFEKMGIKDKISQTLNSYDSLLNYVDKKEGIKEAVRFYLLISMVPAIITLITGFFLIYFGVYGLGLSFTTLVLSVVINYVMGIFWLFVISSIMHLCVMAFGKSDYRKTLQASVYSLTLVLLFFWIPLIGIIFEVHALYLRYKGLKILHGLSRGKSLVALFVPLVIIIPIQILLLLALYHPSIFI